MKAIASVRAYSLWLGFVLAFLASCLMARGEWPMLRGNPQHAAFVDTELKKPLRLAWAVEFEGERLGTATEPIVANQQLFVATHRGHLYALSAKTGDAQWVFEAQGPFLHSPAVHQGAVIAACADGHVYGVNAKDGSLLWSLFGGNGGFSAAPIVADGRIYIGTRLGDFLAIGANDGKEHWRQRVTVPIRQTAAYHSDGKVFVTGEDLRVQCFAAETGKRLWMSQPLLGQTARDYYPVVVHGAGKTFVVVRTNPLLNMGQRIGRDRTMLCRNAGVDDSNWQKVDAWIKSDGARGTPELWMKEQAAIIDDLDTNLVAQSFFVLDGETGKPVSTPPVLWIAGCQGVGAQPAQTADGRLLVFYRSAYGNWNHGVAPLVALGLLDLASNKIEPLFHQQGKQPRWNCFWGTADESQNFVTIGDTVVIVHQGTLSGFDLKKNELFPIHGERDTYGGFRNPPWARNEWHGPARSGVAVAYDRLYWQTGSRILCLAGDVPASGSAPAPKVVRTNGLPLTKAPIRPPITHAEISNQLVMLVYQIVQRRWTPLFVDPGLAGRDFSFDDSGDLFEGLAWAYPHLSPHVQSLVKQSLRAEWTNHPPCETESAYPLREGHPREWFGVPQDYRVRLGGDKQPHPFGNMHAVWLYARRCGEQDFVMQHWASLKKAFEVFSKTGWKLDANKGDLYANRYLSSLLAVRRLAQFAGDSEIAQRAQAKADETSTALVAWWRRAGTAGSLRTFKTSSELDPFIGKGDGISFAVAPHRHKLALFQDLTPEIADRLRAEAPDAISSVWDTFESLFCTWPFTGEERQVHFGENFVDPPDLAFGGFKALAWLRKASTEELARRIDLPFCRADLIYATKLALTLE